MTIYNKYIKKVYRRIVKAFDESKTSAQYEKRCKWIYGDCKLDLETFTKLKKYVC